MKLERKIQLYLILGAWALVAMMAHKKVLDMSALLMPGIMTCHFLSKRSATR